MKPQPADQSRHEPRKYRHHAQRQDRVRDRLECHQWDPTTITPINLATDTPEKAIHVAAQGIAITLNGVTAYAFDQDAVIPIATATNLPGRAIALGASRKSSPSHPMARRLGSHHTRPGLVAGSSKVDLTSINTATNQIGKVVPLTGMPTKGQFFVVITPNGAHIYVLGKARARRRARSWTRRINWSRGTADQGWNRRHSPRGQSDDKFVYVLTPGSDYQGHR